MRRSWPVCLLLLATTIARAQFSFQFLGFLPGASNSTALAISRDGTKVVGASGNDAFLWTRQGGFTNLGHPSSTANATATAVSNNGVVVGYATKNIFGIGNIVGFKWTSAGGFSVLPFLTHADGAIPAGVSNDGSVIVGVSVRSFFVGGGLTSASTPVMWTSSGVTALNPEFESSAALAVSADGSVIVGFDGLHAFRWTSGTGLQILATPLGTAGVARAISADGSFIVGESNGGVRWPPSGLPGFFMSRTAGVGVSADGLTAITQTSIWRLGVGETDFSTYLNSHGLTVPSGLGAVGMSDDATTYVGTAGNGNPGAFIATLTPPTGQPLPELLSFTASPSLRVSGNDFAVKATFAAPLDHILFLDMAADAHTVPRVNPNYPGWSGLYVPRGGTSGIELVHTFNVSGPRSQVFWPEWIGYNGLRYPAPVLIISPTLYTPVLSSTSVKGGAVVHCTLKLNGLSQTSDLGTLFVQCTSSDPAAVNIPDQMSFPAQSNTISFPMQTFSVSQSTAVTLGFTVNGIRATVVLTVNP